MSIEKAEFLLANRDFAGARKVLRSLLLKNKINKNVMYLLSIAEAELGNVGEALDILSRVIAIDAHHAAAHYTKANLLVSLSRHLDALSHHDRAVELLASSPWSFINRGVSRAALKNFTAAIEDFDKAIALDPTLSAAFGNKASALLETNLVEQSHYFFDKAIELDPFNANALSGMSACLSKLKQYEEALVFASRAVQLKPDHMEAWLNCGNALNDLRRHEEALVSYERAIELKPDYAEAWSNRGIALGDLRRHEEALVSYERAIELKPDYAEAWLNRGNALNDLRRHEEALVSYERSIELKPDTDYILGDLVHTQMKISDWTDLVVRCRTLKSRLFSADPASSPFAVLGLFDDPHLQRRCAELHAKKKFGFESELGPIGRSKKKDKIRVGYFSMDFREHPVAYLVAELIETHDRNRFEVYGFSFGRDTGDSMRKRLVGAFDKFLEVSHLSEPNIARLARDHEIDIAIDLGGYTQDSRPALFTHRAAPIQINYLGFPGTMGTKHLDYFIGDRVTVTEENIEHFSEKIIYLPNSFQVNPSSRPIGSRESSRASYGLPESGFVFCCFNNVWKITPDVFKVWASVLKGVDDSVLWLSVDSDPARLRLRTALENLDVDGDRLLFSPRVTREIYFDQYKFANLFLDTLPYNAGTTASDALWMGTPLVTLAGESFAGRMTTSLLHAIGLQEFVTHTTQEYESLAIELANNPEKLASLRARLAENRTTCPLFNTHLFTQHIESAYQSTYDRYHEGLAPDHIYVSA